MRTSFAFVMICLALAAAVASYLFVLTPWLGCASAYAAPFFATAALALALVSRRRERREGRSTRGASIAAGASASILPFVIAFALTCGTMNALGSIALTGLTGIAATAAPAVAGGAVVVAGAAIDDAFPARSFWGSERTGGYVSLPNPVGLGPDEEEGELRAAVRRTVVTTGFLLALYVEVFGDENAESETTDDAEMEIAPSEQPSDARP